MGRFLTTIGRFWIALTSFPPLAMLAYGHLPLLSLYAGVPCGPKRWAAAGQAKIRQIHGRDLHALYQNDGLWPLRTANRNHWHKRLGPVIRLGLAQLQPLGPASQVRNLSFALMALGWVNNPCVSEAAGHSPAARPKYVPCGSPWQNTTGAGFPSTADASPFGMNHGWRPSG